MSSVVSFRQSGRLQLMRSTQHPPTTQPKWVSSSSSSLFSTRRKPSQKRNTKNKKKTIATEGFVDVDFERVVEPPPPSAAASKSPKRQSKASTKQTTTKPKSAAKKAPTETTTTPKSTAKSLIELSLETGDPNWNQARIPFFHPNGQNYIDCKLAFMVDIDVDSGDGKPQKISYGIAVPFDEAVALVEENPKKGKVMYFHPDDVVDGGSSGSAKSTNNNNKNKSGLDPDEMLELMEMMAGQVQEQLGEGLKLCKTPKVLTIRGEGLKELTENWDKELVPNPASVEELLSTMSSSKKTTTTTSDSDDGKDDLYQDELQEFYDFMKAELGQEEFDKTMNQELCEDDIDPELLELFDVPGLGVGGGGDGDGMEEILQSMLVDLQEQEKGDDDKKSKKSNDSNPGFQQKTTLEKESEFITKPEFMDGAALKLLSFNFRGGKKSYSLVKLMQPFVIIGKYAGEMTDEHLVDNDDEEDYDFDGFYDYEADDDDDATEAASTTSKTSQQQKPRMIRFELLTPDEEKVVIPKLEELCRNDLDAAGLSLKP